MPLLHLILVLAESEVDKLKKAGWKKCEETIR
jgi:hypothetical protein